MVRTPEMRCEIGVPGLKRFSGAAPEVERLNHSSSARFENPHRP